jgi:nucleoside-diphosphate-sugar epimerase
VPDSLNGSVGLVTGASGFLGRAVLRELPAGTTVFATYNKSADFPAWTGRLQADVRPIRIDLARDRVAPSLDTNLDWALCMASRVSTASSRDRPVEELVRVAGPAVNSVAGVRAERIVYVSSGSVYETSEGPLTPDRVLAPTLPYAVGKLAGELLVLSYAEAKPWIVRFFGAYGPGEPEFKVTRRLIDAFRGGARTFELTGDGHNRIDPMYVSDAVRALISLCDSLEEPRTLDLCQGESPTMEAFARMAYEAAHPAPSGGPLRIVFSGVAHEQMRGHADATAADSVTGGHRRSLTTGLKEYAEWLAGKASR